MTLLRGSFGAGMVSTPTIRERRGMESRRSRRTAGLGDGSRPLRVGQRSLQLVVEVHRFLQEVAVYKVTCSEATYEKAVCQATLREANIRT